MQDLVSVIVPAYNLNDLITDALASLVRQTYRNIEIVLVDDASTDGTADTAAGFLKGSGARHVIINMPRNSGVSAARNEGLKIASGDFVTFLDGDDYLGENMIAGLCEEASASSPAADVAISGLTSVEKSTGKMTERYINRRVTSETPPDIIAKKRLLNQIPPTHGMLCKSEFLRRYGIVFAENCTAGEDGEFFDKALAVSGRTAVCHDAGYFYVRHDRMGSRDTGRQTKIRRYGDHTGALARTADFVLDNSPSPLLTKLASSLLIPLVALRRMSLLAMTDNRAGFDRARGEIDFGRLFQSRAYLREKPEVFLRAMFLCAFPGTYYNHYAKRYS